MEDPRKREVCGKCHDTGMVKEKDGTIHTCFDCLNSGRMEQHGKQRLSILWVR